MNLVDLIGILPTIFSIILAGLENMKIIGQARFYWSDLPDCDLWQAGQPDREDGEDNEVLAHLQDDSPLCRAPKPFLHLAPGASPITLAPQHPLSIHIALEVALTWWISCAGLVWAWLDPSDCAHHNSRLLKPHIQLWAGRPESWEMVRNIKLNLHFPSLP